MRIEYVGNCAKITALKTEREMYMLGRIEDHIRVYTHKQTYIKGLNLYVKLPNGEYDYMEFKQEEYIKAKHKAQEETREKFSPRKRRIVWVVLQELNKGKWTEIGKADSRIDAVKQMEYWKKKSKDIPIMVKQKRIELESVSA